jgi:hypothetical protein
VAPLQISMSQQPSSSQNEQEVAMERERERERRCGDKQESGGTGAITCSLLPSAFTIRKGECVVCRGVCARVRVCVCNTCSISCMFVYTI